MADRALTSADIASGRHADDIATIEKAIKDYYGGPAELAARLRLVEAEEAAMAEAALRIRRDAQENDDRNR